MNLIYDTINEVITLSGSEIGTLTNNPGNYTAIIIQVTKTCGNPVSAIYSIADLSDADNPVIISGDDLSVSPILFGGTSFTDGIYRVSLVISTTTSGTTYTNCIFIDKTIGCKLAAIMKDIVEENNGAWMAEKKSTLLHVLHYSLVNGSNCGCNCNDMCLVYTEMINILSNIDPTITDCGCQ